MCSDGVVLSIMLAVYFFSIGMDFDEILKYEMFSRCTTIYTPHCVSGFAQVIGKILSDQTNNIWAKDLLA